MVEAIAAHEAFARILPVDQTFQLLQVRVATDAQLARGVDRGAHVVLDALDAVLGLGMRRQPLRQTTAAALLADALQHAEHGRHLAHVVAHTRRVAHAELVGLILVVTAELQEQHLHPGVRERHERARLVGDDHAQAEPEPDQLLLAHALHGVARGDVADLVSDHAGELRFVLDVRAQAARDEDLAARKRECVDRGIVDDGKRPRQLRALGVRSHLLADT